MKVRNTIKYTKILLIISGFVLSILSICLADGSKPIDSTSEEEALSNEKRYVAALAKSGRLPSFKEAEKRSGNELRFEEALPQEMDSQYRPWNEVKRHIGAMLGARGKPEFSRMVREQAEIDRPAIYESVDAEPSSLGNADKRNVAALAGLGGLNAVRYGRFQPQVSGKRWTPALNAELNDEYPEENENAILEDDDEDCDDSQDSEGDNSEDNYIQPNWIPSQQKRYVAALARSGRLPVWHPHKSWGGSKRGTPRRRYWIRYRTHFRNFGAKRGIPEAPDYAQMKNRKCKKSSSGTQQDKRNLGMLARNGVLSTLP